MILRHKSKVALIIACLVAPACLLACHEERVVSKDSEATSCIVTEVSTTVKETSGTTTATLRTTSVATSITTTATTTQAALTLQTTETIPETVQEVLPEPEPELAPVPEPANIQEPIPEPIPEPVPQESILPASEVYSGTYEATWYTAVDMGYSAPPYGAAGRTLVTAYSVASNSIAFGTLIRVEGGGLDGTYRVDDCGGMAGNVVDFYYYDRSSVPQYFKNAGRINIEVYILN